MSSAASHDHLAGARGLPNPPDPSQAHVPPSAAGRSSSRISDRRPSPTRRQAAGLRARNADRELWRRAARLRDDALAAASAVLSGLASRSDAEVHELHLSLGRSRGLAVERRPPPATPAIWAVFGRRRSSRARHPDRLVAGGVLARQVSHGFHSCLRAADPSVTGAVAIQASCATISCQPRAAWRRLLAKIGGEAASLNPLTGRQLSACRRRSCGPGCRDRRARRARPHRQAPCRHPGARWP